MKSKTYKIAELFLLISLPVSLLVACNGETDKKDKSTKPPVSKVEPADKSTTTQLSAFENNTMKVKSVSSPLHQATKPNNDNSSVNHAGKELDVVKVPTRRVINFSSNKYTLNNSQRSLVKQHAEYLRYNPNNKMMISGFSDAQGRADTNYEISKKRANSVYQEFKKLGIIDDQLEVLAYGEAFALQNTASGYDDRRVELDYVKKDLPATAMLNQ